MQNEYEIELNYFKKEKKKVKKQLNVDNRQIQGASSNSLNTEIEAKVLSDDVESDDYTYQWFCIKPKFCKICYNWVFIFIVLNICIFTQNLLTSGIGTVVISTIEKEFYLTSTESGIFLGVFDLAAFISSPVIGYFGGLKNANKMRIIAINLLLMCLGGYIIGSTVFFKDPDASIYSSDRNSTVCLAHINATSVECSKTSATSRAIASNIKYILILSNLIIGCGSVALYSVGIAYVEEIVNPEKSSLCQAIYYGVGAIGGGVGILATGQFLNINSRFYLDSFKKQNTLSTQSSNWIGCWWLPWFIYGFLVNIIALYVFGFPRKVNRNHAKVSNQTNLDKKQENQSISIKDTEISSSNANLIDTKDKPHNAEKISNCCKSSGKSFLKFFSESKIILTNAPFVCLALASATEGILLKGFLGFISKFFEYQYHLSSTNSTIITGIIAIFSVIVGSICGAQIISKFKFNATKSSLFISIIYLVTSLAFWMLMLSCKEDQFIDVSKFSNNACSNCNCTNVYDPVCYKSGLTTYMYQSACHIGCTVKSSHNYSSCSCIYDQNGNHLTKQSSDVVSFSECDQNIKCLETMIIGIFVAFFIVFLTAAALIPHLKAVIGTVDIERQSFALGIRTAIIRVIGNFIGPIIFGSSLDTACIYWKTNCFDQKLCKLYNNQKMSTLLAAIGFTCRFSSFILTTIAFVILKVREKRNENAMKENPVKKDDSKSENVVSEIVQEKNEKVPIEAIMNEDVNKEVLVKKTPLSKQESAGSIGSIGSVLEEKIVFVKALNEEAKEIAITKTPLSKQDSAGSIGSIGSLGSAASIPLSLSGLSNCVSLIDITTRQDSGKMPKIPIANFTSNV